MGKKVRTETLCWTCYKAANGKWCPFVQNVHKNSVEGWTKKDLRTLLNQETGEMSKRSIVVQCPLYIYDYDISRIKQFLEAENIPPEDIRKRIKSVQQRIATYDERNRNDINAYHNYYKDIRLYQSYESDKTAEQLSEEYINGD